MSNKTKEAYELFSDWIEKYEDQLTNDMVKDLSKAVRLLEEIADVKM